MLALTEGTIRASLINTTRKEVSDQTLPPTFATLGWDRLDLLGWRDPKLAKRAYVVIPTADGPVGVLLVRAEASPRSREERIRTLQDRAAGFAAAVLA